MWISKLELTCFKSYQHQMFDFPAPEDGRNIVLIGGMNGFGKTSILEALYLCLYGKEAIIHLARAGLKTDDRRGYPTFLEGAFDVAGEPGLGELVAQLPIQASALTRGSNSSGDSRQRSVLRGDGHGNRPWQRTNNQEPCELLHVPTPSLFPRKHG